MVRAGLAAQERGELATRLDPDVLGPFLIDAWEGTVLRAKVDKSPRALDGFFTLFDSLLGVDD